MVNVPERSLNKTQPSFVLVPVLVSVPQMTWSPMLPKKLDVSSILNVFGLPQVVPMVF
jgi:hypothetical protein